MKVVVGEVTWLVGSAQALGQEGESRELSLGASISEGDTAVVAPGGELHISLADGETLVIVDGDRWTAHGLPLEESVESDPGAVVANVNSIIGQAVAVAPDGSERILRPGDEIYAYEEVRTSPDAWLELRPSFGGGQPVVLEGGLSMTASALLGAHPGDETDTLESLDSIAAIQQAILEGVDPTAVTEATAAGGETASGETTTDGGGSDFVALDRTAGEIDPTAGYPTGTFTTEFAAQEDVASDADVNGATNDAPVADDDEYTVAEDGSVTLTPLAGDSDLDGDTLSIVSINGVALTGEAQAIDTPNGTITINEGVITFTPDENYNGTETFNYVVSDGQGGTDEGTQTITVNPVNDAPTIELEIPATNFNEDVSTTIDLAVAFTDIETADTDLTFSVSGNTHIAVSIVEGVATLSNATADWNGSEDLTFTVTDAGGLTESQTVTVTVVPVVDITTDSVDVVEDTATIINVLSNDDFENTDAAVTAVGTASHGTVSLVDGEVTYTPKANYNGADSFMYTVTSGGVTEEATATLNVTEVNDPLTLEMATPTSFTEGSATEGATVTTVTSATDPDGGAITYSIDDTTNYAIDSSTGVVTLTAAGAALVNADTGASLPEFTVTATSAGTDGSSDTATMTPLV
ncbi:MAG TPA: retention module-containing protein, partial [Marinobacterium sp.]|nr:retention module-containing protein [Marinobacterium sp.]